MPLRASDLEGAIQTKGQLKKYFRLDQHVTNFLLKGKQL